MNNLLCAFVYAEVIFCESKNFFVDFVVRKLIKFFNVPV